MIQFESKFSMGNVITLAVYGITGAGMMIWATFQVDQLSKDNESFKTVIERLHAENASLNTKLAVLENANATFLDVRDTAKSLEIRVREVEKKSDGITSIALEMREIKGELKGILDLIKRVDRSISRAAPIAPTE